MLEDEDAGWLDPATLLTMQELDLPDHETDEAGTGEDTADD
jgi:hypothetical protein